jgi:type II secretory pathway pseudopilin PulG
MSPALRNRERGAALVVSIIMLVLLTLVVITALNIGSSNFRAVGNTQFRDEAIAAADFAVQQVLSSNFTANPQTEEVNVDLDDDGTVDYLVNVAVPRCIFASLAEETDPSGFKFPAEGAVASTWDTVWELDATVAEAGSIANDNAGEAAVRVRSGVRVRLDQNQVEAVCDD